MQPIGQNFLGRALEPLMSSLKTQSYKAIPCDRSDSYVQTGVTKARRGPWLGGNTQISISVCPGFEPHLVEAFPPVWKFNNTLLHLSPTSSQDTIFSIFFIFDSN